MKTHGMDVHEIHFAHRKARRLRQGNPQKRTGTGDVIGRRIFTEIFERIDHIRAVLDLIKNHQRLFRTNDLPAHQRQLLQNPCHVFIDSEELAVLLMLIEVEIRRIFIISPTKFAEKPGLPHLAHSFQNQRLTPRAVLPLHQPVYHQSFHGSSLPSSHKNVGEITLLYRIM